MALFLRYGGNTNTEGDTMSSKYKPTANPAMAAAMRDLRRSSAASPQESRSDRKGSRSARKARAIREDRS